MKKLAVLEKVLQSGIVAIVRTDNADKAKKIVGAISEGGIKVIEVTMSVPGAIDVIKELSGFCAQEGITLGVGSVLDPETARAAILAGAEYVVTPCLNPAVIKLCNRYQVPSMPGAMSVREVVEAMEAGAAHADRRRGVRQREGMVRRRRGGARRRRLADGGGENRRLCGGHRGGETVRRQNPGSPERMTRQEEEFAWARKSLPSAKS